MKEGVVDFHSHLIPGVDDGALDEAESLAALRHLATEGVVELATTPHVDASTVCREAAWAERSRELDDGWVQLSACAEEVDGIIVHRGAELRLDHPEPDLTDPRVRLAGGKFVLVEFPFFMVPPRSTRVLDHICRGGYQPIVAHPERYAGIDADEAVVEEWRAAGAYLQVNGGSLLGRYGSGAKRAALDLLGRGLVHYLSSDYHARGRSEIAAYGRRVSELGSEKHRTLLLHTNPLRALRSLKPEDVPPIRVADERGKGRD